MNRAVNAISGSAKAGAICYVIATLQYVVAQLVVQARWTTPYSWSQNFISDLGNTACGTFAVPHGSPHYVCSPGHAVMNASFVLSGVLLVAGTILLWAYWPRGKAATVGSVLLIVAGAGKILTGIVPENTQLSLHLLGAFNIPLAELGVVLISVSLLHIQRTVGLVGVALGIVGLAGSMLSTAAQIAGPALFLGLGPGGMERVGGYPANLWMLLIGIAVLAGLETRPDSTSSATRHRAESTASRS